MAMSSHVAKRLLCFFPIILTVFFHTPSPLAQDDTLLEVYVEDFEAMPGEQNVVIPIYMKNYSDTVAGFTFWLQLDRPDIMEFQEVFDTSGTLISGWEFVEVNSLGGSGYNILIVGMANLPEPPNTTGIGYPQLGEIPLAKLIADVYDIPDTMTDRTVLIHINSEFLDHFNFSDQDGNSIGIVIDSCPDTTWYRCLYWTPDSICLEWEQVPGPPADSFEVSWTPCPYLDTTRVIVIDGSLTVLNATCGDVDGSGGRANIADLTYLVEYLFRGGPPPPVWQAANVDGDNGINVADLTYLVDFLFRSGPGPVC